MTKQISNGVNKKLFWLIVSAIGIFGAAWFFQGSGFGAGFLWDISNGGKWLLPLIGISALIDSVNPCAFSILILTIAFLFSIGKSRLGILKIGGAYIAGIFITYILIGLGILQALHLFNTPHFMGRVGAVLLIAMGVISIINEFFPSFPIKLRIPRVAHQKIGMYMEKASLPTAFLLGALVGLCEFPCTGGPYLMAIGLLHDNATFAAGFGYLVLYNIIFILPLIVILLIAGNQTLLEKVKTWKKSENKNMRFWGSIAMVVLGVIILFI